MTPDPQGVPMETDLEQPAGSLGPPPADPLPDPPSRVERFLRLGYPRLDVQRVLRSLPADAQTNDILEELIKTSPRAAARPDPRPAPRLVARGCGPSDAPPPGAPSPRGAPASADAASGFRPVVIDGSNVAMSHGNKKVFSCRGLQLAVMWFWGRGMREITVFVPLWRKEQPRPDSPITDQHILQELQSRRILVYTPSRSVSGRRVACYDDRYIVRLAVDSDGIIVSNDNYRDLQTESPQWRRFIEERLLMYTFANDKFMPPDDPLGRSGPTIDSFLRNALWEQEVRQQPCPYGRKCTYGAKCKFYHPERANQSQLSVADELRAIGRPKPSHENPAHLGVALTSKYPSSSSPVRRDVADPRAAPSWGPGEATGPPASLDQAFVSMGGSMSTHSLQSAGDLSSGYASGYSGYCGFHSEPCRGGSWGNLPLAPPPRWRSTAGGGATEERQSLKSQLSALFPPCTVQHIMSTNPHIADMSQLISLLQRTTPLS